MTNKYKSFDCTKKNNELISIILFSLLFIIALIPYIIAIIYEPVKEDSGYYLAVVERIQNGDIPYKDFQLGYTPLMFYITAFIKTIFSIKICYTFDLIIHFGFQILTTYIVFLLSKNFTQNIKTSLLAAVFYLSAAFWINHNEYKLDIPLLFWGLLSSYLILQSKRTRFYVLYGIICSFSFLTKQYGIVFFVLNIYLAFSIHKRNRLGAISLFCIGFSIPILSYVLYNPLIMEIFTGNGYGVNLGPTLPEKIHNAMINIWQGLSYILYRIPAFILFLFLIYYSLKRHKNATFYLVLAILGFSLTFIFAPLWYYSNLLLPFITLFIFLTYNAVYNRKILKYISLFLIGISIIFSIKRDFAYTIYSDKNLRLAQNKITQIIRKKLPQNEDAFIADYRLTAYYYLASIKPTNNTYAFGIDISEKEYFTQLMDAKNILTCEQIDFGFPRCVYSNRVLNRIKSLKQKIVLGKTQVYDFSLDKALYTNILLIKANPSNKNSGI